MVPEEPTFACPAPSPLRFTGAGLRSREGPRRGWGEPRPLGSPLPLPPLLRAVRSLSGDPAPPPHLGTWAPGWAQVSLHKAPRPAAPSLPWEGRSPQGGHRRALAPARIVHRQDHRGAGPGGGGRWPLGQGSGASPLSPLRACGRAPRAKHRWPRWPLPPLLCPTPGKG